MFAPVGQNPAGVFSDCERQCEHCPMMTRSLSSEAIPMADIFEFSIVTYERKPGHWRAAITRKGRAETVVGGDKVRSVVTPDDYASESDAQLAAQKLIRKL
jgi:hypothetical protein